MAPAGRGGQAAAALRRRLPRARRSAGTGLSPMLSPVQLAGQSLVQAYLEIVAPSLPDPIIPLRFNPTEYQLQKANNFAEIAIPGLESPPIQFVRGAAEKLTTEVLVDTSNTLKDVRTEYVDKLPCVMDLNRELHSPPIIRFVWDTD